MAHCIQFAFHICVFSLVSAQINERTKFALLYKFFELIHFPVFLPLCIYLARGHLTKPHTLVTHLDELSHMRWASCQTQPPQELESRWQKEGKQGSVHIAIWNSVCFPILFDFHCGSDKSMLEYSIDFEYVQYWVVPCCVQGHGQIQKCAWPNSPISVSIFNASPTP